MFGMDKSENSVTVKSTCIGRSYTIKVPLPHALKKFINRVFIFVHRQATDAMAITYRYAIRHSHMIHHELLIVDEPELLVLHILFSSICMS